MSVKGLGQAINSLSGKPPQSRYAFSICLNLDHEIDHGIGRWRFNRINRWLRRRELDKRRRLIQAELLWRPLLYTVYIANDQIFITLSGTVFEIQILLHRLELVL